VIHFLLNLEPVQLPDSEATRTVLDFLRNDKLRSGTKEGCGSGDCGACTVAIAELIDDQLVYSSLNSCITLLGALHGKQLITVEDLATEHLHPVQKAMVDHHGSQCGFCTPGFVMSLLVMYKQTSRPASRAAIIDGLAGNLCRCTGYRPIIDAALDCLDDRGMDAFIESEPEVMRALKALPASTQPSTIDEMAARYLARPDSRLVAGSTDLGLEVTQELRRPAGAIFVGGISALRQIVEEDGRLLIGAAASLSSVIAATRERFPAIADLLTRFGSPQIRNQATVGGNLGTASPIGDLPPALLALDASLQLRCGDRTRQLSIADFFLEYRKTALVRSEFIESVSIPLLSDRQVLRVYKVSKRMDDDISAICLALMMTMTTTVAKGDSLDGRGIADIRIGAGGMAATTVRAVYCETAFRQQRFTLETVQRAQTAIDQDFSPINDVRASAHYRSRLARNLLTRFHRELSGPEEEVTIGQLA